MTGYEKAMLRKLQPTHIQKNNTQTDRAKTNEDGRHRASYRTAWSLSVMILFLVSFVGVLKGQTKETAYAVCHGDTHPSVEVWGAADATVSATPVVRKSPNGKRLYAALDITLTKEGREWQPQAEEPAIVTLTDPGFEDGRLLDVYHEGPRGLEFVATVGSENGKITFPAHSFSVYIVAEAGDYARLKVTFHRASGPNVTVYVKKADIAQGDFNAIVYNPGVGTVASGVQFRGWTTNASYGAADATLGLTFNQVRTAITSRLNEGVTDGTEMHFYAMLFKSYTVTYLDERNVAVACDEVPFLASEGTPSKSYTVNASYVVPDNSHKFEGWQVHTHADGQYIAGHTDDAHIYPNSTVISISGNVILHVNISEGHWLIYHENGKGATYKAADFVNAGANTVAPTLTMTRTGYTFDGWWTGAPAQTGGNPTGSRFTFGQPLTENTDVYAKWNAKITADYIVIIWKQGVEGGDNYDFEEIITLSGTVGTAINTVAQQGTGNGAYARVNGTNKRYTGFHLDSYDQNVTIVTEGNAVLNVYYKRNEHTLRFQIESNQYQYHEIVSGSDNDNDPHKYGYWNGEYHRIYWRNGAFRRNNQNNATIYTGIVYTRDYHKDIKTITALYGQSIGDNFPIVGTNGTTYDNGERWDPQSTQTTNDVIVYIDVMPDNDETYLLNTADREKKTMHYYVEALPDATGTVSAPNTLYDYEGNTVSGAGRQFVIYKTIDARYRWVTKEQDFFEINGYHRLGVDKQETSINNGSDYGYCYSNPDAECTLNFYYTRDLYTINFMDGAYYNGNNERIADEVSGGQLELVSNIAYRADVSSYNSHTPPTIPSGYAFEGWYMDKTCTHPYTFDRMPNGGITVFAKWRQVQYRVFLHPNAATDPTLDWGSDEQAMNFRVAYGNRISTPTGIRDDYEFVGWYTDEACTQPFNGDVVTLNETNTTPYDKSTDLTDPMDKWGNLGADPYNSDLTGNGGSDRFWITRKYDLYGKWRAKLRGADGITVVFDANGGTPATTTLPFQYQDNVNATAIQASTPASATAEFSHWVMQRYSGSAFGDVAGSCIYAGSAFAVLKANSQRVITQWYNPSNTSDIYTGSFDATSTTPPDGTHTEYRATYTVRLRAEYADIEESAYTFVVWYKNDGTGAIVRTDGTGRSNPSLGINETEPPTPSIPAAPTRAGYTFKGWYKQRTASPADPPTSVEQCSPNFLYYNNNKYYREASFTNEVTKVAADRYQPDDYLYAVWEPIVEFNLPSICKGHQVTLPTTTIEGVDLSAGTATWSATSGTITGTSNYTPPDTGTDTLTFTPDPATCAQPNSFNVTLNRLETKITIGTP